MYLTPAEQRLIKAFNEAKAQCQKPTISFLAMVLDRSRPTVHEYIRRLVGLNLVCRGRSGYELVGDVCPTCGAVLNERQPAPAGSPGPAER